LAATVKSGDPANVEAEASRRYWPALFGARFRRNRDAEDENRLLNYGYAVLRAIVARAVCAAGLHPSLGLHHHNRYDSFRLADDLMEPFRPIVDRIVFAYCQEHGAKTPLDKDAKAVIIGSLLGRFTVEGESRTLFDIAARVSARLVEVFAGKTKTFRFPEV
jgi:CRISPR-associated protein Cas1